MLGQLCYGRAEMKSETPFTLNTVSTILTPDAPGLGTLLDGLTAKATIIARQSDTDPIALQYDDHQWLLCQTSGSSGQPKTIRRRPATWIASFDISHTTFSISSKDTYATFGALGHSLTLYATLEALHLGADLCAMDRMGPTRQIRMLQDRSVSVLYATPTQLRLLISGARAGQVTTIQSVRHVFTGGGKLDHGLQGDLVTLFPQAQVHEFFGASETSFIALSDANTPQGAVGRPYPGVGLRIGKTGQLLLGQTGEIWVSSPYLFDGYALGSAQETRWDGAFLSIGEMGYVDAQGYLFLKGRKNRMVTVADKNVFPEEIEQAVGQLSGVAHCAALGVPDPARGNRVVCFVQSDDLALTPAVLRRHCRAVLGHASVPKEFVFVTAMPLLPAGKPDLEALSRRLADL